MKKIFFLVISLAIISVAKAQHAPMTTDGMKAEKAEANKNRFEKDKEQKVETSKKSAGNEVRLKLVNPKKLENERAEITDVPAMRPVRIENKEEKQK